MDRKKQSEVNIEKPQSHLRVLSLASAGPLVQWYCDHNALSVHKYLGTSVAFSASQPNKQTTKQIDRQTVAASAAFSPGVKTASRCLGRLGPSGAGQCGFLILNRDFWKGLGGSSTRHSHTVGKYRDLLRGGQSQLTWCIFEITYRDISRHRHGIETDIRRQLGPDSAFRYRLSRHFACLRVTLAMSRYRCFRLICLVEKLRM